MKKDKWHNIPFGYKQDPKNPNEILPIHRELSDLDYALALVANGHGEVGYTLAAEWLYAKTGRSITAPGLRKIDAKRQADEQEQS